MMIQGQNRKAAVLLAALAVLVLLADMWATPASAPSSPTLTAPTLTVQAEQHILHGDKRGGGHLHGTGKACKSEFPADWDAGEVVAHVKTIAANDNLGWERQDNGYYVAEQTVEGTRVRVVLNRDRSGIVTAYPTNVRRNPCPANDNARE